MLLQGNHPLVGVAPPGLLVPLGFHGDDAGIGGGHDKALMLSWGSCAVAGAGTLDSRLLFCIVRLSELLRPDDLLAVLTWSLNVLGDGHWPEADHTGAAWPPGSARALRSGQVLTNHGWRVPQSDLPGAI